MKTRIARKIVKKYSHQWWQPLVLSLPEGFTMSYLSPPLKWHNKKIMDEFKKLYGFSIVFNKPITGITTEGMLNEISI